MLVETTLPGKTQAYFGVSGSLETSYLGKVGKKPSKLKIYNKTQETLDAGKSLPTGDADVVRIERTVDTKLSIKNLKMVINPFTAIEVFVAPCKSPPDGKHNWELFLDSYRFRGREGALSHLPTALRAKYEAALTASKKDIWNTQKIWEFWPSTVEQSGLLDGLDKE